MPYVSATSFFTSIANFPLYLCKNIYLQTVLKIVKNLQMMHFWLASYNT